MTHGDQLLTAGAMGATAAVAGGVRSHQHDEPYNTACGETLVRNVLTTLYVFVAWPLYLTALFVLNYPVVTLTVRNPMLILVSGPVLIVGNYLLVRYGWRWRKKYRRFVKQMRFRDRTIRETVIWARQHDVSWDNARPYRAHCEICDKPLTPRSAITIAQADRWLHYLEEHPGQLPAELALPQLPTSQSFR